MMFFYRNGVRYEAADPTPDELAAIEAETRKAHIEEKTRPLTAEEVTSMLIAAQINTLSVDDNTALRMVDFYPGWDAGTEYATGYKVRRNGKLWRAVQAHTAQHGWEPENAPALWEQVCESHTGAMDDPIPYDGNMALESGKYYIQDGEIYRCTRDTGNPVYGDLYELVGLYVDKI